MSAFAKQLSPTDEQLEIIDVFAGGSDLVVEAGAGTGKSSTLRLVGQSTPRSGLVLYFNRAPADEAQRTFPRHVRCSTAHSLAFRAMADLPCMQRLGGPPVTAKSLAEDFLGIRNWFTDVPKGRKSISSWKIASLAVQTVRRFCYSSDDEVKAWHVPRVEGIVDDYEKALRDVVLPFAREVWADLQKPDGFARFEHDHYMKCQPAGSMVLTPDRGEVPIEQIKEGDKVVSWNGDRRLGHIRRTGRFVDHVGQREYEGDIVRVRTPSGRESSYTHDHICIGMIGDALDGKTVVYLMRRGRDYRIGRVQWRYGSQGNTLGIVTRARNQQADGVWILAAYDSEREAALAEALAQHEFGIPGWQFESSSETMPLSNFWTIVGNNVDRARACLEAHGRDIAYPLMDYFGVGNKTRRPIEIRACNLMDGMRVCVPALAQPFSDSHVVTGGWQGCWEPIELSIDHYAGIVYSIEVSEDHTYVADGIVTHNCWALGNPKIEADWLAVDESQDTNGVLAGVVRAQDHLQRVLVGDSQQRLFAWRGSVDIMHEFDQAEVRYLTQSFRFGDAVAEEANRWLEYLEAPLRLRGLPSIASRLEFVEQPDAVLCRTNADVIEQAMSAQSRDFAVAVVGGTSEISSFASAVDDLRQTGKTRHPELSVFKSWADVQAYVRDEQPGGNFATAVRLIERYGTAQIQSVAARCVEPRDADYVVSTVHKVKGMEWDRVLLDSNLMPDEAADGAEMSRGELMVDYVATTRAREVLDVTALEPFHRRRAQKKTHSTTWPAGLPKSDPGSDARKAAADMGKHMGLPSESAR